MLFSSDYANFWQAFEGKPWERPQELLYIVHQIPPNLSVFLITLQTHFFEKSIDKPKKLWYNADLVRTANVRPSPYRVKIIDAV